MNHCLRNAVLLCAVTVVMLGCAATPPAPVEERSAPGPGVSAPVEGSTPGNRIPPLASDGGSVSGTDPAPPLADAPSPVTAASPPPGAIASSSDAGARAPAPPGSAADRGNPAVVALLNRANAQSQAGSTDGAAATLERALKIEPRNPWLWHRLAALRLEQQRLEDVVALAARSNSLAHGDGALMASNWRLIARVHEARGEKAAAGAARERATQLDPQRS